MQGLIEDAVRTAVKPLEQAVEALSARLAAVEGSGGPSGAEPQKRAARGRPAKAKAQPAEAAATADYNSGTATDEPAGESSK